MARISLIGLLLAAFWAQAQGDIELTVRGNREVEVAARIEESPKIMDTVYPSPVINNPRLSLFFNTQVEFARVEPAGVRIVDQLPQLYHSYAKIGVGSEFMPLGEFYFNQTRSRKYRYGVHLKHLSSLGYLPDYAPSSFDRNEARVFGGIIEKKYNLGADLHFSNDGFQYYGFRNDSIAKDSIRQRFREGGFGLQFGSHTNDSLSLQFKSDLAYRLFSTLPPKIDSLESSFVTENFFRINTTSSYPWANETFALDANVAYNQYKYGIPDSVIGLDTGQIRRNTVVTLSPHVTSLNFEDKLKAVVGFTFAVDATTSSRAYIYPRIEAKASLFNDILIPFVSVDGGLKQNTFRDLGAENPFINPNIELRNTHRAIDFKGGLKGTISKRVGFLTQFRFAHIKSFALFVSDSLNPRFNQFKVIYDTLNLASIEGGLYVQINEKLKIDAIGRYNSYLLLNNSYAWNLPTLELNLRGKYNLFDKLVTQLDLNFQSGRKALVYAPEPETTLENGQYVKNLGLITDINWSVEYLYNNRISAFVQLNNIAAQRYQRWYNYPVQAFQVLGGFTFKF